MNDDARALCDGAHKELACRLQSARVVNDHSMQEAATEIGATKNFVFRVENAGKAKPDGGVYESVSSLRHIASVMAYCGMGWGDFGVEDKASWGEVESMIRRLPTLTEKEAATVCDIARAAYMGMHRVRE